MMTRESTPQLKIEDRNFLQKFVKDACGLVIPDDKEYLFKFRLTPIIESHNFSGFTELCEKLKNGGKELQEEVVTELTTHETFFFRDNHPFEAFRKIILPWLNETIVERKNKSIVRKGSKANIWCAASSTGQEPYSLAMQINKYTETSPIDIKDISILATDVSSKVLAEAIKGVYRKFEVERGTEGRKFIETFRHQFFQPLGEDYEVIDEIKSMVEFKYCNLTKSFEQLGGFDVIFCRNVLIYFDDDTKREIISKFHKMLSPGGFLILGASENTYGISKLFENQQVGDTLLYKKLA